MAVYRITGGGTLSANDADVTGSPLLTGVPPSDFDPTRISQIAVEYSLAIVNHADDDWTENRKVTLTVDGVAVINNAGLAAIARSNGIFPFTYTETNLAAITTWSNPVLTAGDGTWVTYKKNKSNDGSTASITQVAVVVTYFPLGTIYPPAEVFNGLTWVGAEAWNGAAWVVPEVWNGADWIKIKAPA